MIWLLLVLLLVRLLSSIWPDHRLTAASKEMKSFFLWEILTVAMIDYFRAENLKSSKMASNSNGTAAALLCSYLVFILREISKRKSSPLIRLPLIEKWLVRPKDGVWLIHLVTFVTFLESRKFSVSRCSSDLPCWITSGAISSYLIHFGYSACLYAHAHFY